MVGALVVFCLTYLVLASRRLHFLGLDRPSGAVVGAVAMVIAGGLPLDAALTAINLPIIVLLFGVLVIAAYLQEARFFRVTAWFVLTRAGSARTLLFGLTFVTGALSALLLNDTVCVLLTPLVVAVVVEARLPALPYLLALASSANVGGVVSFTGNPQNAVIGKSAEHLIGYAEYFVLLLPVGIACLAANAALLAWLFRRELPAGPLAQRDIPRPAIDHVLAYKALGALVLFVGLAVARVPLEGAAMTAAATLILVARKPPKQIFALVDWQLLVFFAGLLVVVAGIERAGVLDLVFEHIGPVIGRGDLAGDVAFVALVVIGSNIVSNVPLVVVAVAWIPAMPEPTWHYIMLAVASTLAGNLTLFGSVANIIVFESAGPRGEIGFGQFFRVGLIVTTLDLAIAFLILAGERALGLI